MSILWMILLAIVVFAITYAVGEWLANDGSLRPDRHKKQPRDPIQHDRPRHE